MSEQPASPPLCVECNLYPALGTAFAQALLVEVYYPREALVELLLLGKGRNM